MKIPETDSIRELAAFWDGHDVTELEGQLEEVMQPVFERSGVVVPLTAQEQSRLREIANARGLREAELVREWVQEKLPR